MANQGANRTKKSVKKVVISSLCVQFISLVAFSTCNPCRVSTTRIHFYITVGDLSRVAYSSVRADHYCTWSYRKRAVIRDLSN